MLDVDGHEGSVVVCGFVHCEVLEQGFVQIVDPVEVLVGSVKFAGFAQGCTSGGSP